MRINNLFEAYFLERPNRFTVFFEHDEGIDKAHLRDPGRLKELLIPKARLLVRPAENPANRKTKYDVIAVESGGIWVLINSGFHSDLAVELIESGILPEFADYKVEKREYTFGRSRMDFLLSRDNDKMLLEVKGCTLVEGGHAKFPDAPTTRGKKHLEELIKAKKEGMEAAVLFLIAREDAELFSPNWKMDPEFSRALEMAERNKVLIMAYSYNILYNKNELNLKPLNRVEIRFEL